MQAISGFSFGRRTRIVLNLATITVVAVLLAGAVAMLLAPSSLPVLTEEGDAPVHAKKISVPGFGHYIGILNRNMFKAARPKPQAEKKQSLDQLPVAKLKVTLLGTAYSDESALSRAIILEGKEQKLVKVGDTLEGHIVAAIQRRAVVLRKGNQQMLLLIDSADKKIAAENAEARSSLPRKTIKAALQDLDALSRDVALTPATRGGRKGLLVSRLRPGSLFGKAGLRANDLILEVGGASLAQSLNPVSLFKMLDRPQVNVNILRDGRPKQLVVVLTGN